MSAELKLEYTESQLILKMAPFYNSNLTLEKALKIHDMEFGFEPTIIEESKEYIYIGYQDVVDRGEMPEDVTVEHLKFMKDLQESGNVNMFAATPEIQKCLNVDRQLAKNILSVYMKFYSLLYSPEDLC